MNSVVSLPLSLRFYGVDKLCVQVSSPQRSFICDFQLFCYAMSSPVSALKNCNAAAL